MCVEKNLQIPSRPGYRSNKYLTESFYFIIIITNLYLLDSTSTAIAHREHICFFREIHLSFLIVSLNKLRLNYTKINDTLVNFTSVLTLKTENFVDFMWI